MAQKKRKKEKVEAPKPADENDGGLDADRDKGLGFLEAASAAIESALSSDSEDFLQKNKQSGGE